METGTTSPKKNKYIGTYSNVGIYYAILTECFYNVHCAYIFKI